MREGFTLSTGASGDWLGFSGPLLARQRDYQVPGPSELGLASAAQAGDALHEMGRALAANLDVFNDGSDDFGLYFPGFTMRRWLEISRLLQSAGSGIDLVIAALCETEGMLGAADDVRPSDPMAPVVAAFISEASIQYLVSVGHNLANVALRLCVEDSRCRQAMNEAGGAARKALRGVMGETSEAAGWIYHSQSAALAKAVAEVDCPQSRCLLLMGRLFEADAWREANTARNEYFHRWREGFRDGGIEPVQAARRLHGSTVRATRAMGRLVPDFYHRLVDSYPRSVREPHAALMGMVWSVDMLTGEQSPPLPDRAFEDE